MSSESAVDATAVLSLLGDSYVRAILVATSEEPKSASDLSEELDAAKSTIYDRTEEMVDQRLLVERTRIVADGSHHSVFETNVDHLGVEVEDGELVVTLQAEESAAERFTNIWSDLREV